LAQQIQFQPQLIDALSSHSITYEICLLSRFIIIVEQWESIDITSGHRVLRVRLSEMMDSLYRKHLPVYSERYCLTI